MEDRVMRIDRKSSIETEPRTLPVHQLHCAREAATYVINTRSVEEAITIFTKGLEPVMSVGEDGSRRRRRRRDYVVEEGTHPLYRSSSVLRDVLSAPF